MDANFLIDLFSGAGGFSLGAHLAGFRTQLAIDIDPDLTKSFRENFPETKLAHKNLADCEPTDLLMMAGASAGQIQGIIGGPPCQGFSTIGKRSPSDPRNKLVWHFFRHVRGIRPAFFLMENVPGILCGKSRKLLDDALDLVSNRYTVIGPFQVDAWEYGAATKRPRVLVLGYDRNRMENLTEADILARRIPERERATVYDAIHDLPNPPKCETNWAHYRAVPDSDEGGRYARRARRTPPIGLGCEVARGALKDGRVSGLKRTSHSDEVLERFRTVMPGKTDRVSRCPRLVWDLPCTTLRAGTGKDRGSFQSIRPIHPSKARVITVREAARIQGFPDWFQFHETIWHSFRMIGNSVSPYVSKSLLSVVADRLLPQDNR